MQDPFDTAMTTAGERTREVAAILARGYLRLCAMRPKEPPPSTENALDESGDQSPPCVTPDRSCAGGKRQEAR